MKILLTVPSLDRSFGGPVVKASNLAQCLRRLGHTVSIVGSGEAERDGVIAIKPVFHFHSTPIALAIGPLNRAVVDSDVVHIIGFRDPIGSAAAHFAARARVPYVLEPAGMHRRRIRTHRLKAVFDATIGRRIVANANAVIATSSLEKGELVEDGVGADRVVVRPNGLELRELPAPANGIRRRFSIPAGAPLVLHLGRISRKKGLKPLIQAIRSSDKAWLLIAGPDDRDGTLQAIRAEAAPLGERVVIEPEGLWGEDKWSAYAEADAFCLYSETENFGNAAAEAAAAGLPVVVTDACGVAEWLDPSASRVVPYGDQFVLVKSLEELLDPNAKDAAAKAAPVIKEALDWRLIAEKQIEIYENVLSVQTRRRILVVNQYYPPDTSATAKVFEELVLKLVSSGHRVRVLCGRPSYNPSGRRAWRILSRTLENRVEVERVGSSGVGRERMWGRIANYLTFALMSAIRVLVRPSPDIVVAGSDPPFSVWIALLAARGRPVVYSLQDLHPEFAIVSGMIQPGLITKVWDAVHRSALKRSSLVVCLGETMAKRVQAKGVPAERIVVAPLGAPPIRHSVDPSVVAELRGDSKFLCVHAGNLGGSGAWETLALASKNLNEGSSFLFIGEGFNSDLVGAAGIRLLPFRPEEELASVMAAGDLQVVTLRAGLGGLAVPSKLYTVLAHGRPVLAVAPIESEVSEIVRRWECGLVADPSNPDDVAATINWASCNPNELAKMSKRALEAAEHYSRDAYLDQVARLIEDQTTPRTRT